jgi:Domain of unknown function (DUF4333)
MRTWSPLLLVFATACSFSASCGGKKLDMDKAKAFVAKTLDDATGQKPDASCPASVDIKKGGTFECTARFGPGVEARLVIEQDDEEGRVTIKAVSGIVPSRSIEKQIVEGIAKQLDKQVEVNCGERVRAATAGATFQCDAKATNGDTGKINVTVKDTSGDVAWEVAQN